MERTPSEENRNTSTTAQERAAFAWNLTGGVRRHGQVFAAFAEAAGHLEVIRDPGLFERCYVGRWGNMGDFVSSYIEESGLTEALNDLPKAVRPFAVIDYQRVADDLQTRLLVIDLADDGVWVFDARLL